MLGRDRFPGRNSGNSNIKIEKHCLEQTKLCSSFDMNHGVELSLLVHTDTTKRLSVHYNRFKNKYMYIYIIIIMIVIINFVININIAQRSLRVYIVINCTLSIPSAKYTHIDTSFLTYFHQKS